MTTSAANFLPIEPPQVGELVQVRSRRWLVENVVLPTNGKDSPQVTLACAEDDSQGESLTVLWDYELDRRVLEEGGWAELASQGFDSPRRFAAFVHTLQWNCTTATDPQLFQSPFRAGIRIDAYQMEPLRKALQLPRVNLFIADDTGLGKTIEAGLIARELLLRRKVRTIVVAAPPSVLEQWKGELEDRFGLVFEILDRNYVSKVRRERGFGVNPWRTHSRFLVSHSLLIEPAYADPMREWLGEMLPGSLLILDEAHHAAPSSGARYGIETRFTRTIRDLSGRFEHRLFLSATPHNGHSNSFSTLLEILDPHRFTRGVKVRGKQDLEPVMVRRIKEDVRQVIGEFPKRNVVRLPIDGLPEDAPELALSRLLDQYRGLREERHRNASNRVRASSGLLAVGLQQRLLSSIEAFARSLQVHRNTVERQWREASRAELPLGDDRNDEAFIKPPGPDDDEGEWTDDEAERAESAQMTALTEAAEQDTKPDANLLLWEQEKHLLDQMQDIAERTRHLPDSKTLRFLEWLRENLCPGLPAFGESPSGPPLEWKDRRVLIFTESREGTKRYLRDILSQAIAGTDRAELRIEVIDGLTSGPHRKEIQRRFNSDPETDPMRILIATDAAREGLNFQGHCADLFHFDLPWNPGRIEQRNGRIDRKLQPAEVVNCHYFVLTQRVEDRILEVLVNKTATIKRELGSLSSVIDNDVERRLKSGIRHDNADVLAREILAADLHPAKREVAQEELEDARERRGDLRAQIERCQGLLQKSREWVRFAAEPFRDAISCSLEMMGAPPLSEETNEAGKTVWRVPALDQRAATDPSWMATLDSLRMPRKSQERLADWRRDAPIRPVAFEDSSDMSDDTVHLHLEQRVAQRLLARFRSQGFIHHDLSRACLAQAKDSVTRVVLLGRLSLYGQQAERLHEEIVPITARWIHPEQRRRPLQPYRRTTENFTLSLLEESLGAEGRMPNDVIRKQLLDSAAQDIADLRPHLEPRANELAADAVRKLADRGDREAADLRSTLETQRERVTAELKRHETDQEYKQLTFEFAQDEIRELNANIAHWRARLERFDRDLEEEPERIREFYTVRAQRIEPVGLVYLWPETN